MLRQTGRAPDRPRGAASDANGVKTRQERNDYWRCRAVKARSFARK